MVKLSKDGKWYRASLRLMGDGLPVSEIKTKLGIEPDHFGIKGELFKTNGREKYFTNVWTLNSGTDTDAPFEEQIASLLNLLEPKRDVLKEILSMPNVEGQLFLGFSSRIGQGGAFLSRDLLTRVVALGLSIDLDLYPPCRNETN